jgi:hypothetical protein
LSDRHLTVNQSLPDRSDRYPSMLDATRRFALCGALEAQMFK